MLRTLYARLMGFQLLLIVLGALIFWILTGRLDLPEPAALLAAGLLWVVAAAVVLGVLLHPVDTLLLALRRAAAGEPVAPFHTKAPDLEPIATALAHWAGQRARDEDRLAAWAQGQSIIQQAMDGMDEALKRAAMGDIQGLQTARAHHESLQAALKHLDPSQGSLS